MDIEGVKNKTKHVLMSQREGSSKGVVKISQKTEGDNDLKMKHWGSLLSGLWHLESSNWMLGRWALC